MTAPNPHEWPHAAYVTRDGVRLPFEVAVAEQENLTIDREETEAQAQAITLARLNPVEGLSTPVGLNWPTPLVVDAYPFEGRFIVKLRGSDWTTVLTSRNEVEAFVAGVDHFASVALPLAGKVVRVWQDQGPTPGQRPRPTPPARPGVWARLSAWVLGR